MLSLLATVDVNSLLKLVPTKKKDLEMLEVEDLFNPGKIWKCWSPRKKPGNVGVARSALERPGNVEVLEKTWKFWSSKIWKC